MKLIFLFYAFLCLLSEQIFSSDIEDPKNFVTATKQTKFEKLLEYEFSDPKLLRIVFSPRCKEFERLEFLGDRVLGLSVAHFLCQQNSRVTSEDLAKVFEFLVSNEVLHELYNKLNITNYLLPSADYTLPSNCLIAKKTASDIIEALIGAIYKDGGIEAAQQSVHKLYYDFLNLTFTLEERPSPFLHTLVRSLKEQVNSKKEDLINLNLLQEKIAYQFKNIDLLKKALLHSSEGGYFFDVLAFLGVRVLATSVTEEIFDNNPTYNEGSMTQLCQQKISRNNLKIVFDKWKFKQFLIKNERMGFKNVHKYPFLFISEASPRIAAQFIQALLAAIYLDGNWQEAKEATLRLLFSDSL